MSQIQGLLVEHLDLWSAATAEKGAGRGRASIDANHLYGVGKLRAVILGLAVSGKLISSSGTYNSSELLKEIQNEKEAFILAGLVKKSKPLKPFLDIQVPFTIPKHWIWVRLGEITNFGVTEKLDSIGDDVWVLDLEDIEKDTSKLLRKCRYAEKKSLSEKNAFKAGDVLYGKLRPYLNKVLVADEDGVCTTEILPIRCYGPYVAEYFKYVLKSPYFLKYTDSISYGMKMPRLGTEGGREAFFPLPPLEEQRQIADKVNELMSICDQIETLSIDSASSHQNIVRAFLSRLTTSSESLKESTDNLRLVLASLDELIISEASIESLKEVVFQLAIMGKLVNQDENESSASVLLDEINEDKRHAVDSRRSDEKSEPISQSELPFSLPDNWSWARLADVSGYIQYGFNDSANPINKEPLLLRITDIQDDQVNWNSVPGCNASIQDVQNYVLRNGDIVVARTGGTIGKSYLVRDLNRAAIFASYLIRVGSIPKISPEYKKIFFSSPLYWQQLISSSMGTGQPNVNGSALKKLLFPLPPLGEQHRIVAKVNQLINICDDLKIKINQSSLLQQKIADVLVDQSLA